MEKETFLKKLLSVGFVVCSSIIGSILGFILAYGVAIGIATLWQYANPDNPNELQVLFFILILQPVGITGGIVGGAAFAAKFKKKRQQRRNNADVTEPKISA